jgi:hypothetical protein
VHAAAGSQVTFWQSSTVLHSTVQVEPAAQLTRQLAPAPLQSN